MNLIIKIKLSYMFAPIISFKMSNLCFYEQVIDYNYLSYPSIVIWGWQMDKQINWQKIGTFCNINLKYLYPFDGHSVLNGTDDFDGSTPP